MGNVPPNKVNATTWTK